MIVVRIAGGLGNQMFQYAFGRAQSIRYHDKLMLRTSQYRRDSLRMFRLRELNIPDEISLVEETKFMKYIFKIKAGFFVGLQKILKPNTKKASVVDRWNYYGFFYSTSRRYIEAKYYNRYINYYVASFQSEKYFRDYRDIICKELKPKNVCNDCDKKFKKLQKLNTVCVHIRRGDYVGNSFYGICDKNYYDRAIALAKEKLYEPVFVFFSDDIDWCKKNYGTDKEYIFIDNSFEDYEDMYLMSACKNFIISNSTFSWWGQYLSENEKKLVIAPCEWFRGITHKEIDIYMDDWILI